MPNAQSETIAPMSGYRLDDGDYGTRMTVTGPWSTDAAETARKGAVAELYLNYALGWEGVNLDWLGMIPTLKAIQILAPKLIDIRGLELVPQLRRLRLEVSPLAKLDVGTFPQLEEFSGFWINAEETVFSAQRLQRLRLIGYPRPEPDGFARLGVLAGLALYSAKIRSLGDIAVTSTLGSLCLAHCAALHSLAELEMLRGLAELVLEDCKAVEGIESVAHLEALSTLILEDCGQIASLGPVRGLRELRTLRFTGSTSVADGDLTPLRDLPHLQNLGFLQRKHYNLSWRSLPRQLFESRYQLAWS
jgi:hypothetical protein